MSETERPRYEGSCHCGAVRFTVESELSGIEVCNCSLCHRLGYVHLYVAPERFRLETPADAYGNYQFGTFTSENHFCRTCGITAFRRPRSDPHLVDVNVRCLAGVSLDALEVEAFDGRNWERQMQTRAPRVG